MSRTWIGSGVLLLVVLGTGAGLATWKFASIEAAEAASANQPEPMEAVTVTVAKEIDHHPITTSIGTVVALRSITLRNEVPGTVHRVALVPGRIVEAGAVLVALDVSVEEAERKAQEAEVALAETLLARIQLAKQSNAVAQTEVDRALAERDVGRARIARTDAVIAKKTIRAPFRAHVGIADVHPGQYLEEGTLLTTLQGVDDAAYVDFTVAQRIAGALRIGDVVDVSPNGDPAATPAEIVAIDSRVDRATRNAIVRAKFRAGKHGAAPGASVRVRVPVGASRAGVAIPVSSLRKGPAGDHVFVIAPDDKGALRAQQRTVASGTVLGDEVVIESGITAGEQVAASGSFKLRDGVLVTVVGAKPSPSAGN